MSVIVRLQNLPWAANAVDIRQYFHGLSIPEGGVHIVGGELGDAFIAFSTDEDARQAMLRDGGKIKEVKIKLYLSSRAEMQKIIEQARQQSLSMQQFMTMPAMPQIPVPVSNITVPNMSVPNVTIPAVQNVPGMQVPLQNVQNMAAMVSHMVSKPEENNSQPTPSVGILPVQADHPPNSSVSSIKGDQEKDKKDKRRRRTRSHSRDQSDSRSRSRSRSHSRSRSKDRKGRDRYYDRRRRRSRSRDRRRRRDRSRSRERSSRDKRRDHRHGSREDFDESGQSSPSSKWGGSGPRNQQGKPRPEFYSRQSQNQENPNLPKSGTPRGPNMPNIRPPFVNPNQPGHGSPNTNLVRQTPPVEDEKTVSHPPAIPPNTSSGSSKTPVSISSASNNSNNASSPQNFFGSYQQTPPAFNPQQIVSYPSYTPGGMALYNNFPLSNQQQPEMENNKQQSFNKQKNPNEIKNENLPGNLSPSVNVQRTGRRQAKFNEQSELKPEPNTTDEIRPNDIPLPDNPIMQPKMQPPPNPMFGWGFGGPNFGYANMNMPYGDTSNGNFNQGNAGINDYQQQSSNQDWGERSNNTQNNNSSNERSRNTCVQIKSVPLHTSHDDIKTFFRDAVIPNGSIKILGDNSGNRNGIIYVRFMKLRDKKQAICRSGCLLNNSIVNILHIDDSEYDKAKDITEYRSDLPPYWNMNMNMNMNMNCEQQQPMKDNVSNLTNTLDIQMASNIDNSNIISSDNKQTNEGNQNCTCVKIEGSVRFHPFFSNKHKMYSHIRSICDKYKPVDVCVTKSGGQNLFGYMKFTSPSTVEAVMNILSNAKVEGRPISAMLCSEEEFFDAKSNCMPLDLQKFIKNTKPSQNNMDINQDIKNKAKQTSFIDPRIKPMDHSVDDDKYDDDVEMKIEEESAVDVPRQNKVLLPTPSQAMEPQYFEKDPNLMPTNCILMKNLPFQANDHDIIDFFSDVGIIPTQIHIMLDTNGKPSGDAFCEFENNEEASTAASKHNNPMGRNTVFVHLVSRQEMSNALGVAIQTFGPNVGPPQVGPYFSGPPGPPGPPGFNSRGNDWGPPFPPDVSEGPGGPSHQQNFNMENRSRGGGRGGRGSRGSYMGEGGTRGGRGSRGGYLNDGPRGGGDRGRGRSERGGPPGRGGRSDHGRGMGGEWGRGGGERVRGGGERGRGGGDRSRGPPHGRDMRDHLPVPLMSLPPNHPGNQGNQPPHSRPIQLEEDSVRDFGKHGCVVSAENVPYRADINDILDFFDGFHLTPECVIRRYNDEGKITGDARIAFENPSEARRAVKFLHNKMIGNRKISLSLFK